MMEKVDFSKGLVPTVIQDQTGQVLMVAYSNKESFEQTKKTGKVTFFSRSRQKLWQKGESSGNVLEVIDIRTDCDNDALLIRAKPKGPTCHTGKYSCFGEQDFSLPMLYKHLEGRKKASGSYTWKLLENPELLIKKIREESEEVIAYTDRDNLVWEISDLTYFVMVLMVREKIEPYEILKELRRRK
ncbi:MAG: bifunctional phosphoribosyl-AMP cyclohydrolase/phosphoribosyl-ATP diphosphatase HisIE [Candidatus Woesearchaeota archaeon]